jgi:hypothetical protein
VEQVENLSPVVEAALRQRYSNKQDLKFEIEI